MAAGTGKGPPLPPFPSLPLSTAHPAPSITTVGQSLHTPDTSALFMSSLAQDGTPASSFRSLEELLNVTGINSPLPSLTPGSPQGTLTHLARQVDTDPGRPLSPPSKRPRLASSSSADKPALLLGNIHVQPLVSSTPSTLGSVQSSSAGVLQAPLSSIPLSVTSGGFSLVSGIGVQTGSAMGKPMVVPSLYQTPAHPVVTKTGQGLTNNATAIAAHNPTPAGETLKPALPPTSSNLVGTRPPTSSNLVDVDGSHTNSLPGPKALLVQLVQLYKQYQAIGNEQGMQKVKQQLSELTTLMGVQQKLMATHKPTASSATSSVNNPTTGGEPVKPVLLPSISSQASTLPAPTRQSVSAVTQNASVTPTHHPVVTMATSIPAPLVTVMNTSVSSLPTPIPSSAVPSLFSAAPTRPTAPVGLVTPTVGAPLPVRQAAPSLPFPTPTSITGPQSQSIRVALQSYRLKRLQAFLHSLPVESRPRSMDEMREIVRKRPDIFQGLPPGLILPPPPKQAEPQTTVPSTSSLPPLLPTTNPSSSRVVTAPPPTTTKNVAGLKVPTTQIHGAPAQTSRSGIPVPSLANHVTMATGFTATSTSTHNSSVASASLLPQAIPVCAPLPTTSTQSVWTSHPPAIKPGVATPLPPGLTLDTLAMLCRMSDSDLAKLNLPPTLLTAIRVWRSKVGPVGLTGSPHAPLPLVTAPPSFGPRIVTGDKSTTSTASPAGVVSMVTTKETIWGGSQQTVGAAMATVPPAGTVQFPRVPGASVGTQRKTGPVIDLTGDMPSSLPPPPPKPVMIHPMLGFPPRSLHGHTPLRTMGAGGSGFTNPRQVQAFPLSAPLYQPPPYTAVHSTIPPTGHLTRHQLKIAQQKAERERNNALRKVLESSEEARIAYRFQAHLDRMHSQLLHPDIQTPFRSLHDATARLLPYHVWNEPGHHQDAWEKADSVFESVAQLLVSQSLGLTSRLQSLQSKDALTDWEGGMRICLERLFIEGEQNRIEQEKKEKQQAEQIAADLSLMAVDGMTFDPDVAFDDIMSNDPMLSLDSGIT